MVFRGKDKVGRIEDVEHADEKETPGQGGPEAYLLSKSVPMEQLFVRVLNLDVLASHGFSIAGVGIENCSDLKESGARGRDVFCIFNQLSRLKFVAG